MKNFLSIDLGNTNPHFGHFIDGELKNVYPISKTEIVPASFSYAISNVTKQEIPPFLESGKSIDISIAKKNNMFLDMNVNYASNLGQDRLFQAYYLYKNFVSNKNSGILIDAGTFITIDLISKDGFMGGYILPGIQNYIETFKKGANLPTSITNDFDHLSDEIPHNTNDALSAGIQHLYFSILNSLLKSNDKAKVVFTGSQYSPLLKILKRHFNVEFIENIDLIHQSLFYISSEFIAKNKVLNQRGTL